MVRHELPVLEELGEWWLPLECASMNALHT